MKVALTVEPSKIEDYAFLSDTQSGALVSRGGTDRSCPECTGATAVWKRLRDRMD